MSSPKANHGNPKPGSDMYSANNKVPMGSHPGPAGHEFPADPSKFVGVSPAPPPYYPTPYEVLDPGNYAYDVHGTLRNIMSGKQF